MWKNTAVHTFVAIKLAMGVLLVAKAIVMLCQPVIACLLQGCTALYWAAGAGVVAVVETLLLNGADPKARDIPGVCCSSCISIYSIDTAYIAFEGLMLITTLSCSKCYVHVSCPMCHAPSVVSHVSSPMW